MIDYAYYNGVYTPYDDTVIPLSDRSFYFADAVYEVMLGRCGKVHNLALHLQRLESNAKSIGIEYSLSEDELLTILDTLTSLAELDTYVVYIQLSGNSQRRTHIRSSGRSNLLITLTHTEIPKDAEPISAITLPDRRYDYCNLKTTNLLPAVLSMKSAQHTGCDIAIFHNNGIITECSHANIFILNGMTLATPPLSSRILPGITRAELIRFAPKKGIRVQEREIRLDELQSADAILITSTTHFLRICTKVDSTTCNVNNIAIASELFALLREDFENNT